jgi:hypothetical protein
MKEILNRLTGFIVGSFSMMGAAIISVVEAFKRNEK